MPLFGAYRLPLEEEISAAQRPQLEKVQPLATGPQRRRGLFGGMAQFFTPDRLQIIGHTLQEMGGQTGALDNYLAQRSDENERRMQQQRRRVIESREDTEWQRQEVDERALRAWVETLTPERREWARVNPRAAHAAFMASQFSQGDWESGSSFTHAYRVRPDGSVETGGELPLRPYAPRSSSSTQFPDVPEGFVLD